MSRLSREKSVSRSHRDRGLIRRDRSYSAPRSVHFRLEIGRNPRRDRSQPASRSVVLRVEIGPLPPRDRSQPAPRLSCAVHLGRCLRASQWVRRSPLVLCNRANGAVGRTRGSMMRQWAWFSSVLHMGDQGLCGAGAGFCWNDGIFWRASCPMAGLPCAMRGVYAHGSRTAPATDIAVPHDSDVSTDAGCTRVRNTHHPRTREHQSGPPRRGNRHARHPRPMPAPGFA